MEIFSYRNLKENVAGKTKFGFDNPEYWNQRADEVFRNFGLKRTIEIKKVVYGGSDYPVSELYFENGMNLHLDAFEEENEKTLREYGMLNNKV